MHGETHRAILVKLKKTRISEITIHSKKVQRGWQILDTYSFVCLILLDFC